MPMGRKRKTDTHLPPRVYRHGAGFRYVPRGGDPVPLGSDLPEALRKYALIVQGEQALGSEKDSVGWLIDWYMVNLKTVAPDNSPRTIADKQQHAIRVKKHLGHIPLRLLRPFHIREFLDLGLAQGWGVQANRARALVSHACTVAVERGWINTNPCLRVRRNKETKRDRYITDAEMHAVLAHCNVQTKALAVLIYRTLQRPGDILRWTAANIIERDGARVLSVTQSKTGARLDIAISPEIDAALDSLKADGRKVVGMTLIHNRRAKPYTEDGMRAMWTRARAAAGVADFGIYDLKGKGATDMYRDDVPLEQISALCGHESVTTTETYIKARMTDVVQPNRRKVG